MPDALAVLATATKSYAPYLRPDGEMTDPVIGEPTQYGTPYHAYCHAVLACYGPADGRAGHLDLAARGLDAALRHVADPTLPATIAGFSRTTGAASRGSHRDFFWPPVLRTHAILEALGHPGAGPFGARIAAVDIEASFHSRPPSNWAMVWLCGEWLRRRAGLSPLPAERFDAWLGRFFEAHILGDMGLYQEPGHPNSYDLFTRYHLADVLAGGYAGPWRQAQEDLMVTGLDRSLAVQLSDGSLASAYRSTGQTWTLGAQIAYFTLAARHFAARDAGRAARARAAAALAFSAFCRWQRADGPYSPVENRLPPSWRVGYEGYTADGHYGNLAMGFLAHAIAAGFGREGAPPATGARPDLVRIEGDPTHRAICHHGPYSAHLNGWPSPQYDGFGLVDLTFGPGRLLHFVSSARHLSAPAVWYNPGLALRSAPGLAEIRPLSAEALALVGPLRPGRGPVGAALTARVRGDPYTYTLEVAIDDGGIAVTEATPGRRGPRTLLLPYLRDAGTGQTTDVRAASGGGRTVVHLRLGPEVLRVVVDGEAEHVLDLPHGYENRRGLCGLLRIDLAEPADAVCWSVAVEA